MVTQTRSAVNGGSVAQGADHPRPTRGAGLGVDSAHPGGGPDPAPGRGEPISERFEDRAVTAGQYTEPVTGAAEPGSHQPPERSNHERRGDLARPSAELGSQHGPPERLEGTRPGRDPQPPLGGQRSGEPPRQAEAEHDRGGDPNPVEQLQRRQPRHLPETGGRVADPRGDDLRRGLAPPDLLAQTELVEQGEQPSVRFHDHVVEAVHGDGFPADQQLVGPGQPTQTRPLFHDRHPVPALDATQTQPTTAGSTADNHPVLTIRSAAVAGHRFPSLPGRRS